MFNTLRKLFRRNSPVVEDYNSADAADYEQGGEVDYSQAGYQSVPANPVGVASQSGVSTLSLPLQSVLSKLPADLQGRVRHANVGQAELFVSMAKVVSQLSRGSVKISFGELRQTAPAGTFSAENDKDRTLVDLPLSEILPRIDRTVLTRRTAKRQVVVPADVTGPFGGKGEGLVITSTKAEAAAASTRNAAPAAPAAQPFQPAIQPQAPIQIAPASPAPIRISPKTSAPVPAMVAPVAKAAPVAPVVQQAPAIEHETPAPIAPSAAMRDLAASVGKMDNKSAADASPFKKIISQPAPIQAKPAVAAKPPMPPMPQPQMFTKKPDIQSAPAAANLPPKPAAGNPPGLRNFAPPSPSIPDTFQFSKPGQAAPQSAQPAPTPAPRIAAVPPKPLTPPARPAAPPQFNPFQSSAPVPARPTAPVAARQTAPLAAAPAQPKALAENEVLQIRISDLLAEWPDAIQEEIRQLNLSGAVIGFPIVVVENVMKQGKVAFTWKQIRCWLRPPASAPDESANDGTALRISLAVLTPLFLARQKMKNGDKKKVTVGEEIPDIFSGSNGQVVAPPPAPEPASTSDTNYYVWKENSDAPEESQVVVKKGPTPGTNFLNRYATPNEIVSKASALDGVEGALIALPDGLMVASKLSENMNGDVLAAFLPQIFGRVSQSTRELRMGELNNLNFTVGNIPWKIFRVGSIYFAAFGRAGEPLPSAQLAGIAAELDRKPKPV